MDVPDRLDQLGRGSALEQVTAGAGPERVEQGFSFLFGLCRLSISAPAAIGKAGDPKSTRFG